MSRLFENSGDCEYAGSQDRYLQAEAKTKQRKLAFWSQPNPIMPWGFRAGKRGTSSTAPAVNPPTPTKPAAQTSNCSPAYPGVCIPPAPPDLDCGSISYRRFTVLK